MSYAVQLHALQAAVIQGNTDDPRIAVYADGYRTRLVEAVKADYPVFCYYVGSARSVERIAAFVAATPSRHWDLNRYSFAFAPFAATCTEDAGAIALATLEGAIAEVFWLPESPPVSAAEIAALEEVALGECRFTLRTAARLLHLPALANTYLEAFRKGAVATLDAGPEYLCILRHQNEVRRVKLEAMEYALLAAMNGQRSFAELLGTTENETQLTDTLSSYMARWLTQGMLQLA